MSKAFGILNMPVGDLAAKQAAKAAGCTHTMIQAAWSSLQPGGAGSALNGAAVASLIQEIADSNTAGLKILWENAIHFAPAWVLGSVEQFKDQNGNVYDGSGASAGAQVTNWMWTSLGQTYVSDFLSKLGAALGTTNLNQITGVKTGGGYYGELHYAPAFSSGNSFYGYGASLQTGTGLAAGQAVCPLPGYSLFSGTDAQDSAWLNWYLNGLANWNSWFIDAQRTAGWSCDYHVCHPGYGVRANNDRSTPAYQQSAALGEDPARMIGSYSHDPRVWPYCTWLDTADGFDPAGVDSDLAAWKKVYQEAVKRNKHFRLWGENTGGETALQMQNMFSGDPNGSALSTTTYADAPAQGVFGYQGIMWLSYASLMAGGSSASLADYATAITAAS